jgi:hypothetical protein
MLGVRAGDIDAQRRRRLGRSLSPLLGQPNSGIPEFGHYDWPKSDISDFGLEGGGEGQTINVDSAPHPNPLPVKNREREQTAHAALLITPHRKAL